MSRAVTGQDTSFPMTGLIPDRAVSPVRVRGTVDSPMPHLADETNAVLTSRRSRDGDLLVEHPCWPSVPFRGLNVAHWFDPSVAVHLRRPRSMADLPLAACHDHPSDRFLIRRRGVWV